MAQYDDLNTKQIWVVGLISAALTLITILAVQVLYYAMLGSHEASISNAEYRTSVEHIQTQQEQLTRYGRDQETSAIQIPIERAMEIMVERASMSKGENEEA